MCKICSPLKGTWGQNNRFRLKWLFFITKQNVIYQEFQKFACKPQLAYYICSFAYMTSLALKCSLIIQNRQEFHKAMLKVLSSENEQKYVTQISCEMFCTIVAMTSWVHDGKFKTLFTNSWKSLEQISCKNLFLRNINKDMP